MSDHPSRPLFPNNFIWGAATSSYQIEGAVQEDGRGEANWDLFCRRPGAIRTGDTGDTACNHYHLYEKDVELMKKIGLKAYRFSIAWPRVVPGGTGAVNIKGLDFYQRLTDALLEKGILPFATLYHWDLPQSLEDRGGWRNRDTALAFAEYAALVVRRLGDRVDYWMTLNEAPCTAFDGYRDGTHAPGARETGKVVNQVVHHLLLAHGLGVDAVRENARPSAEVGLAHNTESFIPHTGSDADRKAAFLAWRRHNAWWFDPIYTGRYPEDQWKNFGTETPEIHDGDLSLICRNTDFFGLNIYFGSRVTASNPPSTEPWALAPYANGQPRTAMDWAIDPDCLYFALKFMQETYNIPKFYITENGCAMHDKVTADGQIKDDDRINYLKSYFEAAHRALADGVPLAGYFVWSLMDNFEWSYGLEKRFGLVRIDYETQRRTLKKSAYWYKRVIEANAIVD